MAQKTLADLKRDLKEGTQLKMTAFFGNRYHPRVGKICKVIKVKSNGVVVEREGKPSHLEFPRASLIEYDGKTIRFYKGGRRELTEEEREIIANAPSRQPENQEQVKQDVLTDGSIMFHRDKAHYRDHDAEWFWSWDKGKKYDRIHDKMFDANVKGEIELEYEIINQ